MKKKWTKNEDENFQNFTYTIWEQEFHITRKLNLSKI